MFLVGTPETFTVVFANEVASEDYARAARYEWRGPSWTGPVLVGIRMPDDRAQRSRIIEAFTERRPCRRTAHPVTTVEGSPSATGYQSVRDLCGHHGSALWLASQNPGRK